MRLIYFRSGSPNFGDDLNGELWPKLAPALFDDNPSTAFVGIGTIIGMPVGEAQRLHVFSSGIGNDPPTRWASRQVTYWCVRGPISAQLLGLAPEAALTDGAILTPHVQGFPQAAEAGDRTLVIPHFETIKHGGWPEVARLTGYDLVDPRDSPGSVIARIAKARLVLTESLHGAVLADTYGIPWMAFCTSKNFGSTKWVDWRMSLGECFRFWVVPPPDATHILTFGRAAWPAGQEVVMDTDTALRQFDARLASQPAETIWRAQAKRIAKSSAPLRRLLLGHSPEKTAAALRRMVEAERHCGSLEARRRDLQGRMMERFRQVTELQSIA